MYKKRLQSREIDNDRLNRYMGDVLWEMSYFYDLFTICHAFLNNKYQNRKNNLKI